MLTSTLLLTLVPPIEAAPPPATCPEACEWLPLYVRAEPDGFAGFSRGMSSLSGDAASPTLTTGLLSAITRGTNGLVLAREQAFRVNVSSPDSYRFVNGTVSVYAVDAVGASTLLAEKRFVPPRGLSAGASDGVNLGSAFSAVGRQVDNLSSNVTGLGEGLGGPASLAARTAYERTCGRNYHNPDCRLLTGRPVTSGQFALCEPSGSALPRQAVATIDGTAAAIAGRKVVCHNYWHNDVNSTASDVDPLFANVSVPLPPGSWPHDAVGNATNATLGSPPHEWRNATLDAIVPPWMPQYGDVFVLPSGFRLALKIDLRGVVQHPDGGHTTVPLRIEYGTQSGLTALHIRHDTPHAFASFAYGAERILPGTHTGHFSDPSDIDDYAFFAPAGARIDLSAHGASAALFDPDGVGRGTPTTTGEAGWWTIRVRGGPTAFLPGSEYSFTLAVQLPNGEQDDGIALEQGWAYGSLGAGDDADAIRIFAWQAQRFSVTLHYPSDASYRLDDAQLRMWAVTRSSGDHYQTLSARASETGWMTLKVQRSYGAGPYQIGFFPDAGGSLTHVPELGGVVQLAPSDPSGLLGHAGGVFFVTRDPSSYNSSLYYYSPWSGVALARNQSGPAYGITSAGGLLREDRATTGALAVEVDGEARQLVYGEGRFGPDGLYGIDGHGRAYRMKADRTVQDFGAAPGFPSTVLAHPDGSVYAQRLNASYRFDVATSSLVPAPHMVGVEAVDHYGGLYRIVNSTLVERYDSGNGGSHVVARSSARIVDIALAGPFLYAQTSNATGPVIAIAHIGYPGFEGFRPDFAPAPAPDLVVADVRDVGAHTDLTGLSQTRLIQVTIENRGGSAARGFDVWLWVRSNPLTIASDNASIASLGPGESRTLTLEWDTRHALGDRQAVAMVDLWRRVTESNESNNYATAWTYAWIGGDSEICRAALRDVPVPPQLPPGLPPYGDARTLCGAWSG